MSHPKNGAKSLFAAAGQPGWTSASVVPPFLRTSSFDYISEKGSRFVTGRGTAVEIVVSEGRPPKLSGVKDLRRGIETWARRNAQDDGPLGEWFEMRLNMPDHLSFLQSAGRQS